jgi:hypothetical protein
MTMNLSRALSGLLLTTAVVAQSDAFEQLELRVSSVRPGNQCVIDRGRRDLVQVGDRVMLSPRNGRAVPGRVLEVEERTALVELVDPQDQIAIGMRGHLLLPRSRRPVQPPAATAPTPPTTGSTTEPPAGSTPAPKKPRARRAGEVVPDEEWEPGMPLLGMTRPPRPDERLRTWNGRLYTSTNLVRTNDTWSHSFLTTGADIDVGNVDGKGSVLRFHGDFNASRETSERTGTDLRLYELSYERGGTRQEPWRWRVGRFLQRDMPEFGILDGGEIGYRQEDGDRFGASFGYLPELDEDLESFADLQFAAWYIWNQDVAERVSFAVGYQKTWHRFELDRDLLLVKGRLLPVDGWDVHGGLWIDFYTGSDKLKDQAVELTRANLFASRRWVDKGGLEFRYDHEEYPETIRRELPQRILPQTLRDAYADRLTMHAFTLGSSTRWFLRMVGWMDEQRSGGAFDVGSEFSSPFADKARLTLAAFQLQGLSTNQFGLRLQHGGPCAGGRLDLLYELSFVHHEGFPNDRDDVLQHRLGGLLTTDLGGSWSASFYSDATFWDQQRSFGIGCYLQKNF